jgi:hypothetical protein
LPTASRIQPPSAERASSHAIADESECERGGQREAEPRRERARQLRLGEADPDADLARRRTGQKLAERHQVGIAGLVDPAPAHHEGVAEIAEMRDRPAERGEPEP